MSFFLLTRRRAVLLVLLRLFFQSLSSLSLSLFLSLALFLKGRRGKEGDLKSQVREREKWSERRGRG